MSDKLIKKIFGAILVPIILAILGWATWVTQQAFSAQQTEIVLQNHKTEAVEERIYVREQFKSLNEKVDKIDDKIDKNQQDNNQMLMDIQKQIGEIKK